MMERKSVIEHTSQEENKSVKWDNSVIPAFQIWNRTGESEVQNWFCNCFNVISCTENEADDENHFTCWKGLCKFCVGCPTSKFCSSGHDRRKKM